MNKEELPKKVEYEDLSDEGKALFDKARPLTRKERKDFRGKGWDVLQIATNPTLMVDGEFWDLLLEIVYGEDEKLDNLQLFEEAVLTAEIIHKCIYKVGQRESKNSKASSTGS